ncbi:MAG: YARHG domain-containing protein [Acutalibacteraceae bacterium]
MNDLSRNKVIIGAVSSVTIVFIVCLTVILVTALGVKKSSDSGNGNRSVQETSFSSDSDDEEEADNDAKDYVEYSYEENTKKATTAPSTTTPPAYYPPAGAEQNRQLDDSYLFPSDTTYLTYDILSNYSREEIRYITNEMYARHGKIYTQEPYKSYFASKSWYHGTDTSMEVVRARFNDIEAENLETIADYERMKGWRAPKEETTTAWTEYRYDNDTYGTTVFEEPIMSDEYKSFKTGTVCRITNTTPYHDGLNLRSRPSKDSELLGTLAEGTVFEVQADYNFGDNSYIYVSYYNEATGETILGWIFGPYLETF